MSHCPECDALLDAVRGLEAQIELLRGQLDDANRERVEFEREARRDIQDAVVEEQWRAQEEAEGGGW